MHKPEIVFDELPFEKQLVESLRQPGSHLMVLNSLSDSDSDEQRKNAVVALIQKRMEEFAEELEKLSDENGVAVSLKTVLLINNRENE